jgi:SAM-dependent methyltransferase
VRLFESWNNARTLARIRRHVPPPARVLEIGIGSGSLLNELRRSGYDVHGCDLSAQLAGYVREAFGIDVFVGPLRDFEPSREFDVVVMNHVVEHTSAPLKLLTEARHIARPEALFHIAVPNVGCWEAWLPGWTSYEPYHLVYYTPATLRATAMRAGMRVIDLRTFEPFSGWSLALLRSALGRSLRNADDRAAMRSARRSSGMEHAFRAAMLATGTGLYPLRRIQSALGRGEEIILLASNGRGAL